MSEELKTYDFPVDHGDFTSTVELFYLKSEADAVLAEKDAEIRRLKRALWFSRAKAYRYITELITCFNPDYVRNRRMFTPNNLKQKQMNSLKWARLMLKIESACRAKADTFKEA